MKKVRVTVTVDRCAWRALRDLAEESPTKGRASVADVLRELIRKALGGLGQERAQ